jgi:hypothetical protein
VTSGDRDDDSTATLELINTELTARLTRQTDVGKGIDTKAAALAGFAAVGSQFLATRSVEPVLATFAYAAYALAFGAAVGGFAVATYKDVPKPRRLADKYGREPKAEVLRRLVAVRVVAIEENADKYDTKARRWRVALAALVAGLALSVVAMVQTGDRDPGPGKRQSSGGGGGVDRTASAGGP